MPILLLYPHTGPKLATYSPGTAIIVVTIHGQRGRVRDDIDQQFLPSHMAHANAATMPAKSENAMRSPTVNPRFALTVSSIQ